MQGKSYKKEKEMKMSLECDTFVHFLYYCTSQESSVQIDVKRFFVVQMFTELQNVHCIVPHFRLVYDPYMYMRAD